MLTPPVYLCYIFSMNPQIYRTKNTIPNQNTPHFNKIYFLQSTPHLKPTAPKLRVLYNIYKTYFFQSTSTWRLTAQMRILSSRSYSWQGDQHTQVRNNQRRNLAQVHVTRDSLTNNALFVSPGLVTP